MSILYLLWLSNRIVNIITISMNAFYVHKYPYPLNAVSNSVKCERNLFSEGAYMLVTILEEGKIETSVLAEPYDSKSIILTLIWQSLPTSPGRVFRQIVKHVLK